MSNAILKRPGIYRRAIRIRTGEGWARADMEDDPHRFGVMLRHDGHIVTAMEGLPLRTPWTLCPQAAHELRHLVGMQLAPDPLAVIARADARQQCTHMFDLAGLAVAHAARGIAQRDYEIEAPWHAANGPRQVTLRRDGAELWTWVVDGMRVLTPEPFAGRELRDLILWGRSAFNDPDMFEAVMVMRRAVFISTVRIFDLDDSTHAESISPGKGACFVYQPERANRAIRVVGSTRDFTASGGALLSDLEEI